MTTVPDRLVDHAETAGIAPEMILLVRCPACDAPAGQRCWARFRGWPIVQSDRWHAGRVEDATAFFALAG